MTTIRNIQPGEQVFIMNLILPQTKMCTSTIFKSSLSKLCRQKKERNRTYFISSCLSQYISAEYPQIYKKVGAYDVD